MGRIAARGVIDREHDPDEVAQRVPQPSIRDVVENPAPGRLGDDDAAVAKAGEVVRGALLRNAELARQIGGILRAIEERQQHR